MIKIWCKNTGTVGEFTEGQTLLEIAEQFDFEKPWPVLCAKVNNVSEGLKFRVFNNRKVEFLDYRCYLGRSVYSRSLCFLLCKAAKDVLPEVEVVLRRPISKGYFCCRKDGEKFTREQLDAIEARMHELVDKNLPFHRHEEPTEDAVETFRAAGKEGVVKLLETSGKVFARYYDLDGTIDYFYDCLVPSTGYLKVWGVKLYHDGILLRLPDRHQPDQLAPFFEQPKTFEVLQENIRWNKIMGLGSIGDVNTLCEAGHASELIQVSEALQEKKIVHIAEDVHEKYLSGVRIVLITGPSSSGKTTFCKRLSVQLKACGLHPISFSTDDYFVNRVDTPLLPDGNYDFDNFETVDHKALQADVIKLIAGEAVQIPEYNFVTGIREYNGKTISLTEGSILLIEGIHALNPELIPLVDPSIQYKIFINTITSLSIDDHNTIPTSDNRLLRRIVRDYNIGAFSPCETISNWPNVRRAESKWIYPYQETADVLFNSAYLVEFAVLRSHAEQILRMVPKNRPEYSEAYRLMVFLHYFVSVPDKEIPPTSLLREFVGGSSFKY